MIAAGISPKLVAQRHRHSNVSITFGWYARVQPGQDQAAVHGFRVTGVKAATVDHD